MATARLIAKSLSTSEKRARLHQEAGELAEFCQALYPLIVAHADDYGRLDGSVFHVKHAIEPTSPRTVTEFESALLALTRVQLVEWYFDSKSKPVIQIVDFKAHQPGLKQRNNSRWEPCSEVVRRVMPGDAAERREMPRDLIVLDSKRNETIKSSAPRVPADNVNVITKIAHEAIDMLGVNSSDLGETVKSLCGARKIEYDSETVRKCIESAQFQRKGKRPA